MRACTRIFNHFLETFHERVKSCALRFARFYITFIFFSKRLDNLYSGYHSESVFYMDRYILWGDLCSRCFLVIVWVTFNIEVA